MSEQKLTPTSGSELATQLDCAWDLGVVVAILPNTIDEVVSGEVPILDRHDKYMHIIEADVPGWGWRVMDLVSATGNPESVKWWRVRDAAQQQGLDLIPVRWQGPISEIPEKYFELGRVLAVRFYQHGPFFFPLEKPVIAKDEAVAAILEEAVRNVG